MRILQSPLGTVRIAPVGDLFQYAWEAILEVKEAEGSGPRSIALTGGSTPKAFYQWVRETAANQSWPQDLWWTTSDERFVPLDSPESNQGNAWRELCAPLGVSKQQMALWQTETLTPEQAAQAQSKFFAERIGQKKLFQLCFLGMGDDGHTASLFPGSPLLVNESNLWIQDVEVPDKGMRLTLTPAGLAACDRIIVMLSGKSKASRLREVMQGTDRIQSLPIRVLGRFAEKVTWLVDPEAASEL